MKLPRVSSLSRKRVYQDVFAGLDRSAGSSDGAIYHMENLSSDLYPLLSPRKPRSYVSTFSASGGICATDRLCWVNEGTFYYDGLKKGSVSEGLKTFCVMGSYVIIMPDKKYYNKSTDEFGSIESTCICPPGSAVFSDGTLWGESACANTLSCSGVDFSKYFKPGDAVTISGCTLSAQNNKTPIIRQISEDGHSLYFYDNVFTLPNGKSVTEPELIFISRTMPSFEHMCSNANRLWGCVGSTIYASKPGDIFNWNVFDGLESDSYAVDVSSPGNFTACFSFLGYPIFFKEDMIYKVYGTLPSNFEVISSATLGVKKGSGKSLAVAGETLFYLSNTGITAYTGGIPSSVSNAFGDCKFSGGCAGSDGRKYYISMTDQDEQTSLFVFDTATGLWHREDNCDATHFAYCGSRLYMLLRDGNTWMADGPRKNVAHDGPVHWQVDFCPMYDSSPDKKGLIKLQLRCHLDEGTFMDVWLRYDSRDHWIKAASLTSDTSRSYVIPVVPRRCDHFELRLSGTGHFTLQSIAKTYYSGSSLRSTRGRN